MSACKIQQDKLLLYLNHELDKEDLKLMEIHLDECKRCRGELKNLSRINHFVSENLPLKPAPVVLPVNKYRPGIKYLIAAAAVLILIWVILPSGQIPQRKSTGEPLSWDFASGSEIQTLEYEYQRLVQTESDIYSAEGVSDESGNISTYLYDLNTRIDYLDESQLLN